MKPNSAGCSSRNRAWLAGLGAALLLAGAGCESMQRKFVRKKKGEVEAPSPIITFEDYNRAVAPIDLYRKHYLMFEYWNTELQRELEGRVVNPKRVRLASEESLTELGALQRLLTEEAGAELAPVIEERRAVDRQLRDKGMNRYQGQIVKKTIDAHARLMNGRFFWREVKDQLRPREGAGPDAMIPPSGSPATP